LKSAIGWATAVGVCVLATAQAAWAQGAALGNGVAQRPPAAGARLEGGGEPGEGPAEGDHSAGERPPGPDPEALAWSPAEVEAAQARCAALLRGIDVVAEEEPPLREGAGCGAPAPMRLISIGKSPKIAFTPPPTVSCDLIAALHKWLQHEVQTLARTHLGAPVVRIETMSSYSCRNAYGRVNGRLSEHARANALDIAAFATAGAESVLIAADWGPTAREITAAARAAASKTREARPAAKRSGEGGNSQVAHSPQPSPVALGWQQPAASALIPGLAISGPESASQPLAAQPLPAQLLEPFIMGPPHHLGGPKAEAAPLAGNRTDFLRAAHRAACRIFGTVLGPEANAAHKNHFHLDMAERKVVVICE
jgi:hypothetical protein